MTSILETLRTPGPMRNLLLLGAATVGFSVAAAISVSQQREATSVQFEPELFFPDLSDTVNQTESLVYTLGVGMQGTESITLERDDAGGWVVKERNGYPARNDRVRKTILGLTELEAFEPRTANPEWHRNLGLLAPEDLGRGIRVQLLDGGGEELASLIAGEVVDASSDIQGRGFLYVRRDGDDQTWLARGSISLDKDITGWLDRNVLELPEDNIRRVTLWDGTETPAILSRLDPAHPNFIVENVPDGKVGRGAPLINASAKAFADFAPEDAVPAESFVWPDPPVAVIETFDGVSLRLTMTGAGSGMWVKMVASVNEGALGDLDREQVQARVDAINARVAPWAFKMEQNVGLRLTQTMDALTRAAASPVPMLQQ